ncbi:MAG: hypothetical protein JW938_03410, partial [Candidatus Omnitrophica bacterium]|nr:hypothetical protein [Candidatus Omnitrophota bacterium]
MGYLGYYLLASIIVSFGIIIRTVTKSEQARRRLSYIALSGIIVLLMLFSFAHAYNLLDQSALLVIFLALFPLFSLSYLFATYTLLELTGRERVCLLLYVTHTFVLLGIIAYLSWHVVGTPLTIPLFCHYIIVSTIAGWIVGLVWTWRKFRKITEFA